MLLYIKEILREGEKMNYCDQCGEKLIYKENGINGKVPFCPHCQQFKFPTFNSAISAIVFNPDKDKILLIQQYGKPYHVLVAGYINKGENAKEALVREIKEETGLSVVSYVYNDNEYYSKSNTLIHNYAVRVETEDFQLTDEVDDAKWYGLDEVLDTIKPDSLAKSFLQRFLAKL